MSGTAPVEVVHTSRGAERRLLAAACLTTTLVPISSTMIAVALPEVRDDFGISVAAAVWLVSSYLVVTAAAQPVAGGLGDRWGRRRLVQGAIVGFGASSLLCALAPTFTLAVIARCLQAVCGALALVNAAASVRSAIPAQRRGRAFGAIGASATLAAASGPPVGALALALGGWRATFLAVLPLVALALFAVHRWLPAEGAPSPVPARRFDLGGALLLLLTLAGAAVLVNQLSEGRPVIVLAGLGAVTVVCALLLGRVERAHPAPVLDRAVLRVRAVAAAGLAIGASNLALYLVLLAVPLLIEDSSGAGAGVILAPMLFGAALCAPIGGRVSDRWGRRAPAIVGNALLALAMAGMIALDLQSNVALTAVLLGLAGIGLGLSTAAIQTAGAEALPAAQAGVAAGLSSASRYLGSIMGTSLLAVLVAGENGRPVFVVAAVAAIVSMLAAAALPGGRPTHAGRQPS